MSEPHESPLALAARLEASAEKMASKGGKWWWSGDAWKLATWDELGCDLEPAAVLRLCAALREAAALLAALPENFLPHDRSDYGGDCTPACRTCGWLRRRRELLGE